MVELAVVAIISVLLWGSAAAAIWWGSRLSDATNCATCHAPLSNLPPFPLLERQHLVRWCETCGHVEVLVHGAPSARSYCPDCHRRALVVTVHSEEALRPLRIDERCELCGFEHSHPTDLAPLTKRQAKVLAFRPKRS
jgi:hypothetical protein